MLTREEEQLIRQILSRSQSSKERQRDERGRFLPKESYIAEIPEESRLDSTKERLIKVVKVKGSYRSYDVKTRYLDDVEKEIVAIAAILGVLAIIF
ncbi:hypothetical protein [Bacillus sp. JJ1562]|uniref:hypothetical protein n=1 Tax=Bacillus sp. JJ1562 TaxID=3122960 RepID=UPI003001C04D